MVAKMRRCWFFGAFLQLGLVACSSGGIDAGVQPDAGSASDAALPRDAGPTDAAPADAGSLADAAAQDASGLDADAADAGGAQPPSCPAAVVTDILDCVTGLQMDPEFDDRRMFLVNQLLACADVEPVAAHLQALCAADPAEPACALRIEDFAEDVLPDCFARAREQLFAGRCVLPATHAELRFSPWLVELAGETLSDVSQAPAGSVRERQLVAAVALTSHEARTAAEALRATDDEAFELRTFLDVGSRRTLELVTATFGDNRYGRIFFAGTPFVVADIIDTDIGACAVEAREEGRPCDAPEACARGRCLGLVTDGSAVLGEGRCVLSGDPGSQPSRGRPCADDTQCPRDEGLVCVRLGDDAASGGYCEHAWLRRRFAVAGASIEGPVTRIPFVVSGVATVSLRTTLTAIISHPSPGDLTLSLEHPAGGSRAVVFADPAAMAPEVVLRDVRAPLPADEGINGTWTLIIEDAGGPRVPGSASVFGIEVAVQSWFD
jgi:hypothetical protein